MKRAAMVAVAMTSVFIAGSHVRAQAGNEMTARLTASIERKIQSEEPVRLSADTITLTGDTLRLSGHAQIVSSDTKIQANEIVFSRATKRVELVGVTRAFGGTARSDLPRIEFR